MNDDINATGLAETKNEKFRRLANDRLDKALTAIESLEPLTNDSVYEYGSEEVAIILEHFNDALDSLKAAFERGGPAKKKRELL
jgi:hypothetical protein